MSSKQRNVTAISNLLGKTIFIQITARDGHGSQTLQFDHSLEMLQTRED